jgi:hypothetical protein
MEDITIVSLASKIVELLPEVSEVDAAEQQGAQAQAAHTQTDSGDSARGSRSRSAVDALLSSVHRSAGATAPTEL